MLYFPALNATLPSSFVFSAFATRSSGSSYSGESERGPFGDDPVDCSVGGWGELDPDVDGVRWLNFHEISHYIEKVNDYTYLPISPLSRLSGGDLTFSSLPEETTFGPSSVLCFLVPDFRLAGIVWCHVRCRRWLSLVNVAPRVQEIVNEKGQAKRCI